jgi:RNA polymerase sigma-70 factor (ECF subfamily)
MNDHELIEKFNHPDSRNYAFNLLVRKYQQKVYWHIRKMVIDHDDADDLTQETFIKAWRGLENFKGESQLYTWLYRIATNECLNFLAKKKRRFFFLSTILPKNFLTRLNLPI